MKRVDAAVRMAISSDQNDWNTHVSHPLQSWQWGEFRTSMGVDVVRLIDASPSNPDSMGLSSHWQLTFHSVPHTPWTIGYFPKGPAPTPTMLDALVKLGKEKRAIFIQIEPNVTRHCEERSYVAISFNPSLEIASLIARNDKLLRPSHHPLFTQYTFILDLTKSEEELLSAMHSKTRYNIRVAQKHGVVIKEDNSDHAFGEYLRLSEETTERQGFFAHNHAYHEHMWQTLRKAGIASLWTANIKSTTVAALIIFAFGDTIYYPYGASSRDHANVMAPNLLLWEIARWGKKQEYKKFDLWGAMGPPPAGGPDEHDPWYGFHRFKAGYNPDLVEFAGSYDLIISPLLYKAYQLADIIRWTILKKGK